MEQEPNKIEPEKSIENVDFKIVEKSEKVRGEVMDLLHEYPQNFVHGLFEQYAEQDFAESDIIVAYDGNTPIGCLMFNRTTNEYNWLAVKKDVKFSKTEIAKRLFESFYPTIQSGTEVHFFVNTEDAQIPGQSDFSGKNFEPARKLYRSMGLELKEENRVENKYGQGAHAYRVEWTPNKTTE
jgi:hypothetical protein